MRAGGHRLTPVPLRPTLISVATVPSFASESWTGGFCLDRATGVQNVTARHGVVLAATDRELLLLRAGEEHLKLRDLPGEALPEGTLAALAIEPRRGPRLAVGCGRTVTVFDGDRIGMLHIEPSASPVEALAWKPPARRGSSAPT